MIIDQPFQIFSPYADTMRVSLFCREDISDEKASHHLGAKKSAGLHQVHGKTTVRIFDEEKREQEADGMLTTEKNIALCIRWADCQNFILFDPTKKILGTLHAGWRGLVAGAISECCETLREEFGCNLTEVLVGAGPSLCQACSEFSNPIEELPNIGERYIDNNHVDLQAAAQDEFLQNGILSQNFERSGDCTRCLSEKYWTYRGGDKDAVLSGSTNMLSAVLI